MRLSVTLEQIENGQARLLIRPQETLEIIWPADYLPAACNEGDILTIELSKDQGETEAAQARVKNLLDKLLDQSRQ